MGRGFVCRYGGVELDGQVMGKLLDNEMEEMCFIHNLYGVLLSLRMKQFI